MPPPAWIVNIYYSDGEYSHYSRSCAVFDTELEAQQHRDMCLCIQKDIVAKDKFITKYDFVVEKIDAYP